MKLNPCVSAVVLGFHSADDTIQKSQFDFTANDPKNNYFEGDKITFSQYLIDHFCNSGSTILDLTDDSEGL